MRRRDVGGGRATSGNVRMSWPKGDFGAASDKRTGGPITPCLALGAGELTSDRPQADTGDVVQAR